MKIIRLTQTEHDEAVEFMTNEVIDKRYSDYLYTLGEPDNRRLLRFQRQAKSDWQLVTPIMIVTERS